jgi:predicted lipid-binding transport protein (Tim44 family)
MTPNATRWLWIGLTSVIVGLVGPFLVGLGNLGSTLLLVGGIGAMVSLLGLTAALIRGDRSSSKPATVTGPPRPRAPAQDVEQAGGPVEQRAAPDQAPRQVVGDTEADRKQRLDPKNRPANSEVDNTKRVFDPETGRFVDR